MTAPKIEVLPNLFDSAAVGDDSYFTREFGLFGRQEIHAMTRRRLIQAYAAIEDAQFQPASLDLRLGKEVYRVRASFLPGRDRSVLEHLESLNPERISLTGNGAVLEKGIVYIAPLICSRAFPGPPIRRAPRGASIFSRASSSMAARLSTTCRSVITGPFTSRFRRAASACAFAKARGSIRSGSATAIQNSAPRTISR
jgi:hypothetical protein